MADENETAGTGHNGPDFKLARDLIGSEIQTPRDEISKKQGELSAGWKRVEKEAGVNKKAAKAIFGLLSQSAETQTDYIRSFVGLAREFGLGTQLDLVDLAQGGSGIKNHSLVTTDDDEDGAE